MALNNAQSKVQLTKLSSPNTVLCKGIVPTRTSALLVKVNSTYIKHKV